MLDKTFEPAVVEPRCYALWEASGAFAADPDSNKAPYTIMMPPPNVTGSLHMGHALTFTLQDVLVRYQRMRGRDVLWQPGTDHAGIATEIVVGNQIAEQGGSKRDLGRERFIARVWEWKEQSGGTITRQLRRLGASPDWQRERFTLDPGLAAAVRRVFVALYRDGLVYRDQRLVNWDPEMHTVISDLEVESRETKGCLWHIRYPVAELPGRFITVATTRPETMLGDTAVAVHPDDPRFADLVGKSVRLPLAGRLIPIIADEYADPETGSGAVKITPAHDFNDFEVGRRHGLALLNIFDADARINDAAPTAYRGLDRFAAREKVVADLDAAGLLEKIEDHTLMVPHHDRSGVVIEPWLTDQWFCDARALAGPAIAAVEDGRIPGLCRGNGKTRFSNGCATFSPGASRANCGGGTGSRPGTGQTGRSSSPRPKPKPRPRPRRSTGERSICGATRTCSTPGFHRHCGRSQPWAGPSRPASSPATIRATCWSPASTSSFSGSPG